MAFGSRSRTDLMRDYDVLVVGGGNAALCAAMVAHEAGAKVLIVESSPIDFRGGNSRHTRNIRYMHDRASSWVTGPYLEDEFYEDLLRVTGGKTNEELARLTIRESFNVVDWMEEHGGKLAKLHGAVDAATLRSKMSAPEVVGFLAWVAGLRPTEAPATPAELLAAFNWDHVNVTDRTVGWVPPKLRLHDDAAESSRWA